MNKNFGMGLKPSLQPHSTNPFTKVNGNIINSFAVLSPSAIADRIEKLLFKWASCPTGQAGSHIDNYLPKCLIQ